MMWGRHTIGHRACSSCSIFVFLSVVLALGCNRQVQRDEPDNIYIQESEEPDDHSHQPASGEPESPPGIQYDSVRPNIMLLVDRSGSMAEPADCGEARCPSKWDELVGVGAYLNEVNRGAILGLSLFPSPDENGCSVRPSVMVPLTDAPNADERIMDALLQTEPGGSTPLTAALREMGRMGGLDDPDRDNILVILTDGHPNCECDRGDQSCERVAAVDAVESLVNRVPDVHVYVIGFGSSAQEASETLTALARVYGGRDYYQANTIEDLISLLYVVGAENTPCTYFLDEWPEPDQLVVWLDYEEVEPCTDAPCDEGYTYDPLEGVVQLHGATCAYLRNGERHMVWFDEREEQ